jgi:hypothetical protein
MKGRAKTYKQFINEAYIDDSGNLQDFNYPSDSDHEYQILDHAYRILEYLEDSGAEKVRLYVNDELVIFNFVYIGVRYTLTLNLDLEESNIEASTSQGKIEVFNGSTSSLFDLISSTGLEFLNY